MNRIIHSQWHQGGTQEEILSFIIQVCCSSVLPLPFIIQTDWIDWNWPCWLFTPSVFWLLGRIAMSSNSQPKSNVTITLLLPFPGDYSIELLMQLHIVQRPLEHLFFCTAALFCVLTLFFCTSLSPFSFSIKGHPSAKYGSTSSCYPNSTVSALWTRAHWRLLLAEARLQTAHAKRRAHSSPSKFCVTGPEWFTECSTQSNCLVSSH